MAPTSDAEKNAIRDQIMEALSNTSFACSSLDFLSGGTTNFVLRGTIRRDRNDLDGPSQLSYGIQQGTKTVIVKYTTGFAAVNRDFGIDDARFVSRPELLGFHGLDPPANNYPGWHLLIHNPRTLKKSCYTSCMSFSTCPPAPEFWFQGCCGLIAKQGFKSMKISQVLLT
jgi:hypothetical protein